MKKGFTLVELSIVLVVIGILMGMAIKGRSMVEAAQVKKDMAKIQNISTAIGQFYSKYGMLPGKKNNGKYTDKSIYDDLINEGTLNKDSFEFASFKNKIHFAGCTSITAGAKSTWTIANITPKNNICVVFNDTNHADNENLVSVDNTKIKSIQACYVEMSLDDGNIYAGNGKVRTGSANNTEDFSTCTKLKKSTNTPEYLYRIY